VDGNATESLAGDDVDFKGRSDSLFMSDLNDPRTFELERVDQPVSPRE
jgi:hypothetical protein